MDEFISTLQSKKANEKRKDILKRILLSFERYCVRMNIHYIPTTFVDSDDDEWLSLHICRDNHCNCFELLEGNYFVCKEHLLLHSCYPGSISCNKGVGERGVVFCKFTGNDHSKYTAISDELYAVPTDVVDTFQDAYPLNRSGSSACSFTKTPTYVKKSEFLFQNLKRNIETVVHTILDPKLRKQHNELVLKSKSLKHNMLPNVDENVTIGQHCYDLIISDVLYLCKTALCGSHNRKTTLLLLKHMMSFVCYMLAISMRGLSIRGKAIRKPCVHSQRFTPMPCNVMLKRVFRIKLTKYAECMKCLQTIMEGNVFLNNMSK